jgi:pSer/pThr/pTyr-binding forkhead associated (FHA) protein
MVVLCHRCGARNERGSNFCNACGASLTRDASEDTLTLSLHEQEAAPGSVGDERPHGVDLLLVNSGTSAGARFALEGEVVTAGRGEESDIFLDDVTVSREHARLSRTPSGRVSIRDLGSLNGTYVNHVRVNETTLDSGDEVQIGKFKLIYIAARDR